MVLSTDSPSSPLALGTAPTKIRHITEHSGPVELLSYSTNCLISSKVPCHGDRMSHRALAKATVPHALTVVS